MTASNSDHIDNVLPEVRAALVAGVRARHPKSPRRSLRAVAVGLLVLAGGGTALAATDIWNPVLGWGDEPPRRASTPVPDPQVAALSVLRTPQTEADRGADVETALATLSGHEHGGVRLSGVRLLARRDDGLSVLVPLERAGSRDQGAPSSIVDDPLCVIYLVETAGRKGASAGAFAGQKCGSSEDLAEGKLNGFNPRSDGVMHFNGLVPDGVTHVEVHMRDGEVRTGDVARNFFDIGIGSASRIGEVKLVRWLGADGEPIAERRR